MLYLHFDPPSFIADDAALILNLFPILVGLIVGWECACKDEDCNPINKYKEII
jgi:hypothetical protein